MRLNLGCGDDRRDGYVNIDLRGDVADLNCNVDCLPFDPETVDEILAFDILEHFPRARIVEVLGEWARVLKPGGLLEVRVPNLQELARWLLDGRAVRAVIENIYGGHRWGPGGAWDTHHTGWTPELLEADLKRAGFRVVTNDEALNMTVEAIRK